MRHLAEADRDGALALARRLAQHGATPESLITELLAPAQTRVGALWQSGAWSVAQEHAATNVVDAILAEVELQNDVVPTRGSVVLGCVEGEWHVLPARMLAEQLRRLGWSVTFLGGSMPATDLERFLEAISPVAVALSCSMSVVLPGAQRSVAAAHRLELPVVAGGPGFGVDGRRATSIGADGWADTCLATDALLRTWSQGRPSVAPIINSRASLALAAVRGPLLEQARRSSATDADLVDRLLSATEAALVVDDPTVVTEVVAWLSATGADRHESARRISSALEFIGSLISPQHHAAAAVIDAARHAISD